MKSLAATMKRRAFGYIVMVTLIVTLGGAAGMYALEKETPGFESYSMALWWTAMRVITAGNEFNPATPEGRGLAFLIAVFGYTIFGYVTATFATFFIGRDAEEKDAPVAGSRELEVLRREIRELKKSVDALKENQLRAIPYFILSFCLMYSLRNTRGISSSFFLHLPFKLHRGVLQAQD